MHSRTLPWIALLVLLAGAPVGKADQVVIHCYRGPWKVVLFDRPMPPFAASLSAVGFSMGEARKIARKFCRDPELVFQPDLSRARMITLLAETRAERAAELANREGRGLAFVAAP